MATMKSVLYRFDEFEVDPANRVFSWRGEGIATPIQIPSRAFDLLLYMVRNPQRLLTKEELMGAIWGDVVVEEGNLTQSVFLLRKGLSGAQPGSRIIVTVPGRGYRFDLPVAAVPVAAVPAVAAPVEERAAETVRPIVGHRRLWFGVAAMAIVLGAAATAGWFRYNRTVPGDHHGIVLADFENTTGDTGFDKALNVALAIDLKQSPFLTIAPDARTRAILKQMERPAGEKLTAPVAREVCQRMDDQAVLAGIVARFGQKFLITLTASDCVSGLDLVQTKAEADSRDNIPRAVDSVAADMRKRLGEPLKSLQRFNKPLLQKETGSLDALKAYTQAHELAMAGKFQESVPPFKRAIELDPRFAIAYSDLGVIYSNLGEPGLSAAACRRSYELRDLADEPDRLFITARYHTQVTGDLHESIRDYELWTEMYAHESSPWTSLGNAQTQIGRPDLSIDPAKRAIAIDVNNAAAYVVLARAQMRSGRMDEALATCQQAIIHKLDGADIHGLLLEMGFARRDKAATDEQIAWAKGTSAEPFLTVEQTLMTFAQGRPRAGRDLLNQIADGYRNRGMQERADRMLGGLPRLEAELGMTDEARKLLLDLPPIDGSTDVPVSFAESGESARAEALLREDLKKFPEDTLWQYVRGPQIQAAILLSRSKPAEAVEALRRSLPYDMRSFDLPAMRGRAYLADKQYAQAEAEFRKIVNHPTVDPLSEDLPLAHLGLARALALEGNAAGSREEYMKFFDLWKDAEPDVPVLGLAKAEYAQLSRVSQIVASGEGNGR